VAGLASRGRRRWAGTAAAVSAVILVSGCGLVGGQRTIPAGTAMTVTSQAFSQTEPIPAKFTCHAGGRAKSPSIHWTGEPAGTKSLALIVDDSSAPITPYIYWIVFDIGPQTSGTLINGIPTGAREADNSKGTDRYDPPCPVNGSHTYRFTVYALDRELPLPNGVSLKTAWTAIAQATIARGRLAAIANS